MPVCPECGNNLAPGAVFCAACGTRTAPAPAPGDQAAKRPAPREKPPASAASPAPAPSLPKKKPQFRPPHLEPLPYEEDRRAAVESGGGGKRVPAFLLKVVLPVLAVAALVFGIYKLTGVRGGSSKAIRMAAAAAVEARSCPTIFDVVDIESYGKKNPFALTIDVGVYYESLVENYQKAIARALKGNDCANAQELLRNADQCLNYSYEDLREADEMCYEAAGPGSQQCSKFYGSNTILLDQLQSVIGFEGTRITNACGPGG